MAFEIIDQRRAPRLARLGVAERIELKRHAVSDVQFLQQLVAEGEQLHVGLRLGCSDDLGIELVELAEAALLRALVAKGRAVGRDLERRILLPTFAEISAADAGGELGAKRDRFPAAILERIHLLRDDVGRFTDRPGEYGSLLDRRDFDAPEPVQAAHAI